MCHWDNFIYVTAHDEDDFPNSAPYDFTVIEDSGKGKWAVEPLNGELKTSMDLKYRAVGCAQKKSFECVFNVHLFRPLETTVILRDHANLWPGKYKVRVDIKDQQGKSCADVQTMDVVVCTCDDNTKNCKPAGPTSKNFSPSGILLLLLGLLLLLREYSMSHRLSPQPADACWCRLFNSLKWAEHIARPRLWFPRLC